VRPTLLATVFLAATLLATSTQAQNVTVGSTSPPEAKMAAMDTHSTSVPQATLRQYGALLNSVDTKCKEDRAQIANMVAKGVELLEKKGVTMTYLKFLQSLDGAMPKGSEALNLSCAEMSALLVTMIDRP
jgi:hypothetical protein